MEETLLKEEATPAVVFDNVTKRFNAETALDALNWHVPARSITALLGSNGAGKTTALRCLINQLRPTRGQTHLLGKPSTRLNANDFTRIGYVSADLDLPEWMTLGYLIDYLKPMYPLWDDPFCSQLLSLFELPLNQRIGRFSRGMKMKAACLASLAYHPEILILDEPFSGLDVIVREDLIDALLDLTTQARWTILLSSHEIEDIERLVDRAVILNRGRLLLDESVESLQRRFRQISFLWPYEGDAPPPANDWLAFRRDGRSCTYIEPQFDETTYNAAQQRFPGARDFTAAPLSLKQIYVAVIRARKDSAQPTPYAEIR